MTPRLWPTLIFVMLAINATVVAITVYAATSDRSFAVEPSYYQHALAWNETARQRDHNSTLGWTIELRTERADAEGGPRIRVRVLDRDGTTVNGATVVVTAFHNARASHRLEAQLAEASPGEYRAELALDRAGEWEFRFTVSLGNNLFTAAISAPVSTSSSLQGPGQ